MAQINITLDQNEILQLLQEDHSEAFRLLLQNSLNSILKEESAEQLKAAPYERSEKRTDNRNGFRERQLNTQIGKITLAVPRHRNQPFHTLVFDNYTRSESALILGMAEMVVNGVSTRKVSRVMETLCGTSFSKSAVSEACKELDKDVEAFRNRPIVGTYPFLVVDATYFKVRENHRVISKALMIAYGTNSSGHREVIGFGAYPNESARTWEEFLKSLKQRGLQDPLMITSDAHEGLRIAMTKVFPEVPWQRCQYHFIKNISDKTPVKYQKGIQSELHNMFNQPTLEKARQRKEEIIDDYKDIAEDAMRCLDEGFESAVTAMFLPAWMRVHFRTSNHLERINRELKRRSEALGIFPNTKSMVRIMGSVLIEYNDQIVARRAIFTPQTYLGFAQPELKEQLKLIAQEQAALLVA